MRKVEKFYCPRCSHKTLVGIYRWDKSANRACVVWECRYRGNPSCGCVIRVAGRDAEISDYHNPLDLIVQQMDRNPIINYIVEHDHSIRRRGLELVHETKLAYAVRQTDSAGRTSVVLYWKTDKNTPDWSDDAETPAEKWHELSQHDAIKGNSFFYREENLGWLLNDGHPLILWEKKPEYRPLIRCLSGPYNTALIQRMIEWMESFEEILPIIFKRATEMIEWWDAELQSIETCVGDSDFRVHNVDCRNLTATLSYEGAVTVDEAIALSKVWPDKLTFGLVNCVHLGPHSSISRTFFATAEQAKAVEELLQIRDMRLDLPAEYKVSFQTIRTIVAAFQTARQRFVDV